MAKSIKKKNRKLRRQIRKTLGALFMVSAITVAAIPVPDVSAVNDDGIMTVAEDGHKIQVLNYTSEAMTSYDTLQNTTGATLTSISSFFQSSVPFVNPTTEIYTTGDGTYQFAFVRPSSTAADEVAVVLGANVNNLPENSLAIPNMVDAYKKYTANSTSSGYCAVSRDGKYLYYAKNVQKEIDVAGSKYPAYSVVGLPESDKAYGREITTLEAGVKPKEQNADGTWTYVYVVSTPRVDASGSPVPGEDGNQIVDEIEYTMVPVMVESRVPCYYDMYSEWSGIADNMLYYWSGTGDVDPTKLDGFSLTTNVNNQRIYDASVQYIGRQYLVANANSDGKIPANQSEWKIGGLVTAQNRENGVFAGKGQIVNLEIGDNLLGIGDYAFYGCTGLRSVTLGNGLNTIGNGAFADCINMQSCNMQLNSNIAAIGEKAFQNCQGLTGIVIPVNVRAIGDYCFDGCIGLETIDLCGQGQNVALQAIGYNAFTNCSSLTELKFPQTYADFEPVTSADGFGTGSDFTGIPITYLTGCTALQRIIVQNSNFTFLEKEHKDDLSCAIGSFLQVLPEIFYIEGPEGSAIHTTARRHSAAFKYLGKDIYEKVVWCPETEYDDETGERVTGTGHEGIFMVDSSSRLIDMDIEQECGIVEIPANIGYYGVETIGSTSFQDNCFLIKIIIPSTVKFIESNAFKGCHNLKHVVFSKPVNIENIGAGAFNTQSVSLHKQGCTNRTLDQYPILSFTGEISPDSVPFLYAMDSNNNINVGTQSKSYITFYSGWPTNLTVRYNQDTDKNELIDYPRYEDLAFYTKWTKDADIIPDADPEATPEPTPDFSNKITYPDLSAEYAEAAREAVSAYEAYKNGNGGAPTQDQMDIINSALNINLPAGIESIKHGIFSDIVLEKQRDYDEDEYTGPVLITNGNENKYKDKTIVSVNGKKTPYNYVNSKIESITMNTVENLEPYTFAGCTSLTGFYMSGGESIGDYVFYDCSFLTNAEVAPSVKKIGTRPFAGCKSLTNVAFGESPYFTCENGIIFGMSSGAKNSVIECLELRGGRVGMPIVGPDELSGITSIAKEAFMGCTQISMVDLTSTSIEEIPEGAFRDTPQLMRIDIPKTIGTVEKGSFWNSAVRLVYWWGDPAIIAPNAFRYWEEFETAEDQVDRTITFQCLEGGTAEKYAKSQQNPYINPENGDVYMTVPVIFYDYPEYPNKTPKEVYYETEAKIGEKVVPPTSTPAPKGDKFFSGWDPDPDVTIITEKTLINATYNDMIFTVDFYCSHCNEYLYETQFIEAGKSAIKPEPHDHTKDGVVFTGWTDDWNNIHKNTFIVATYSDGSGNMHTVTFLDEDGVTVQYTWPVVDGATIEKPPSGLPKSGKTFVGWVPAMFTNIDRDMYYTAVYKEDSSSSGSGSGGNGSGGSGSNATASPSASPSSSPEATPGVTKYTVSVSGGSGSGQYAAGEIVALNAYFMGSGQNFDRWTTSTAGVGFANPNASSTTFTMPAANVAITATYTTGSGTPVANSSGGGSSSSGNGSGNNNGTSVQVTRPGISNEGLAGATVSGATDNFVVKVTEDQSATNAVVAALQARYGDISRIKYLPMDISLYDSTGRTKIADTSGISVNLTLPIPDDLVQYAGNNKVAAIANGSMEDLNVRFTTVDGVPCVNFTATHFSPYVIYVDTANLTESTIDASPKTGDPIHPKWFLAMGMACVSLILFFKRDKVVVKAKTA